MPVQHFSMACDSDDEYVSTPKQTTRTTQYFSMSPDSDTEEPQRATVNETKMAGCAAQHVGPSSSTRRRTAATSAMSTKKMQHVKPPSTGHREKFGFSLCDDSEADEKNSPIKSIIESIPSPSKSSLKKSVSLEIPKDQAEKIATPATTEKGVHKRPRGGAALLLGRQIQAIKADKEVDKVASIMVAPTSADVEEHIDNVMGNLSYRQRLEVQRHIDTVMRSAAERMGCRNMLQKQELCDRASSAIREALERKAEDVDDQFADFEPNPCFEPPQSSRFVDPEWELALRAKVRLAVQAACQRRAKESMGIEEKIDAARWEAQERRCALHNIEARIMFAAQEACMKRGSTRAIARAASFRPTTRKPRVEIPEGKLDEYVGRIYAEAKARAKSKPANAHSAVLLHTSLDDTQLMTYFRKVVSEAKARSGKTWESPYVTEVAAEPWGTNSGAAAQPWETNSDVVAEPWGTYSEAATEHWGAASGCQIRRCYGDWFQ